MVQLFLPFIPGREIVQKAIPKIPKQRNCLGIFLCLALYFICIERIHTEALAEQSITLNLYNKASLSSRRYTKILLCEPL